MGCALASLWLVSESDETETKPAGAAPRRRKKKKRKTGAETRAPEPPPPVTRAPEGAFAPSRIIFAGAAMAALGLAIVSKEASETGRVLWIAGILALAFGIHRLGRTGPDDAFT